MKQYERAVLKITEFEAEDVITTSGQTYTPTPIASDGLYVTSDPESKTRVWDHNWMPWL